jgi:hypothetical protein
VQATVVTDNASKDPERPTFKADGGSLGLVEMLHPDEHRKAT